MSAQTMNARIYTIDLLYPLKLTPFFQMTLEHSFCDKCGNTFMGQCLATGKCASPSMLMQVLNIIL